MSTSRATGSFGRAQEVNLGDITADANILKARQALGRPVHHVVEERRRARSSIGSIDEDGNKVANPILPGQRATSPARRRECAALRQQDDGVRHHPAGSAQHPQLRGDLAPGNGGFPQIGGLRFSYDPTLPAGSRVRSVALYDEAGSQVAKVVENGLVVPGAPATISMIALNFTANGGDGYPIKGTANGSNYRFVLNNGTLSAPVSESLDFTAAGVVPANALGEQKAFEDYLRSRHATQASAYNLADSLPRVTSGSRTSRPAPTQSSTPLRRCSQSRATSPRMPPARRVHPSSSAYRRRIPSMAAAPLAGRSPARWVATVVTSPSVFPIGTTTVICTASDLAGNASTPFLRGHGRRLSGWDRALEGKVGRMRACSRPRRTRRRSRKLNEELAKVPEQEEAA